MSSLSMVTAINAVPRLLTNLDHMLHVGEENAAARSIDPDVFLNARLAPDMYPLKKQVQAVAGLAKMAPYRIAGLEPPKYDDTEQTFAELYALIAIAKADFAKVPADKIEGSEDREFEITMGMGTMAFTGISYLSGFIIPNLHFHSTTAYNILRAQGVPLGKFDYFGRPSQS